MEIVITHTIHPDVIALLKSFVSPFTGGQQATTQQLAAPVAETVKPTKTKAVAPAKETLKETPAAESTTSGQQETKKLEFTDLRQAYMTAKDAGKQEQVRKLLTEEYQVEKLSQIKPEQFEEVYNKIKAL